jgi:hypothetical protein
MIKYKFTLRNDTMDLDRNPIGRFDAFFSEEDTENTKVEEKEIPSYVKIKDAIFKARFVKAGNKSIFIAKTAMKVVDSKELVDYEAATKTQFFFYRIRKDTSQKLAFGALIAAVIGVLIDVSFAIGKIHVFIHCSSSVTVFLLGCGMVLKILGLWLVFKKGFWESK